MASQTRSAGLGQAISNLWGTVHWISPTNIYTSNNIYSSVDLDGVWDEEDGGVSHYLRATTFGFNIPAGATIDGIYVEYEKKCSNGFVEDDHVYIVSGGSEQGTNKARIEYWSTTESYVPYGGATDKWGLSWVYGDINSSSFGVSINCRNSEFEGDDTAYVDHVRITVYYTPTGTNLKIKVGTVWKDVSEIKIKVGTVWKPVTAGRIKIGDVWKTIFG